jgi:hypothetical protein
MIYIMDRIKYFYICNDFLYIAHQMYENMNKIQDIASHFNYKLVVFNGFLFILKLNILIIIHYYFYILGIYVGNAIRFLKE